MENSRKISLMWPFPNFMETFPQPWMLCMMLLPKIPFAHGHMMSGTNINILGVISALFCQKGWLSFIFKNDEHNAFLLSSFHYYFWLCNSFKFWFIISSFSVSNCFPILDYKLGFIEKNSSTLFSSIKFHSFMTTSQVSIILFSFSNDCSILQFS